MSVLATHVLVNGITSSCSLIVLEPNLDIYTPVSEEETCYIDFSVTSNGTLYGRNVSHQEVNASVQKIKDSNS